MMIAGTELRRQGCSLQDGKQWGINTGGAVRTSTLPIPFTNVFLAVASTSSEWCCPGCSATNTTVTTRAYQSNRPDVAQPNDVNWIIIGCQPQWGNLWAGYTEVLNWYFPLTTSQVYAVCLTKHTKNISSGHNWEPARIEEWNNSYARIHPDGDLGYSVIAICKAQQQWGYQTVHGTNPVTYDLPIPFEEAPFTVAISTGNSGNHASCGGFTKTTIVLRAGTTAGVWDTVGFFIIGCQLQWGYAGGSRGTFPIAFGQFFSMASVLNNAIEAWERACYNITNTSFQINYGGPILYLAIGKA